MQYNKLEDSGETPQARNINPSGSVTIENNLAQMDTEDAEAKCKKYIKWGIIGAVALIAITLAIVLPLTLGGGGNEPGDNHEPLPPGLMNPYGGVQGTAKYSGSGAQFSGSLVSVDITKVQKQAQKVIPQQFLQYLNAQDTPKKVGLDWRNVNFFGPNNELQGKLDYTFDVVNPSVARLQLSTSQGETPRFSIPSWMVNQKTGDAGMRLENLGLSFFDPSKDAFCFKMVDVKNPKNVLLTSNGQTLLFADKYIQMDYILPTQQVYGFGDRVHEFLLKEGAFTMWSSGQQGSYDDGRGRGGLSGVHPFLLVQTATPNIFIGLYFRNANAMTPVIRFNDDGTSTLSFITIGGQVELYIIGQGTAHEVLQNYQGLNGLANLPPFWSLGWQEASPQGTDQAGVLAAAKQYLDKGYPLDAVYLGSDSWDNIVDFKLDATRFPNPAQIQQTLKASNQRLVAYIDSAINVNNRAQNPVYKKGGQSYIQSTIDAGMPDGWLVNKKQGKQCVYLDWMNGNARKFWADQVTAYQTAVNFDGLWTTMNEPFGETDGEIIDETKQTPARLLEAIIDQSTTVQDGGEVSPFDQSWFYSYWPLKKISTYILPFVPELLTAGNYDAKSLSLNGSHVDGYRDYDVHSLYPLGMAIATTDGIKGDNRRFYLSKGSFTGMSQFTGVTAHTNNNRTWDSLSYGLSSVLRSQMFGLPMSGSDVCGYYANGAGALDEELCLRWYQLATFFPLARHSQDPASPRTDPLSFKNQVYAQQVQKTMHDRMQYLRLLYTCLYQTSTSGGSCLDPVQFHFTVPAAKWGKTDFTSSYVVGGALLVSPIMSAVNGATTFKSYLPKVNGAWVNMADWSIVQGADDLVTMNVRDTVNVHLAPGNLVPVQNNTNMKIMTTADALAKPISLVVNRNNNGQALGQLFLDQGISQSELYGGKTEYYNIRAQAGSIQVQASSSGYGAQPHQVDEIVLVNAADLSDTSFACYFSPNSLVPQPLDTWFNKDKQALIITPQTATKFSQILNIYYGSSDELNVCNQHSFDYNIVDGKIPDLTTLKNVTFNLTHMAGTLDNIQLYIGFHDTGIINVKWTWDNQTKHQRVPVGVPNSMVDSTPKDQSLILDVLSSFITVTDKPFTVTFQTRIQSAQYEPVLTIKGLLFDEYLNWVNVDAYTQNATTADDFIGVFGLGERASKNFFYKSGVYSMWAKDIDNPLENGALPGKNNYGVHPFYMFKHASKSWVGVYHNLAQAQDWWVNNDFASGKVSLSTISTGGLGDLFIFTSAGNPESIIAKYHSLIGAPVLAPQWALGWNQCRWCYRNLGDVQTSMQGYIDNKIPLDTQWVDIDYMQDYKDFEYNAKDMAGNAGDFAGLPQFVNNLHAKNMRFVPIVDAGVSYRPNQGYQAFDDGMKDDIFMKVNGQVVVGKVWPNEAAYPDWFHPKAQSWWGAQLDSFQGKLAFDGLWQDMNEASNFCNGVCSQQQTVASPIAAKLRYTPTGESLETKAISLDVVHFNNNYTQLDAHSLFGAQQVAASNAWFSKNNRRTMVISRSSFAGMGKYGSAWLGDNHATIDDLEESVISIMNMNMFGVPLVGADICGFGGPSTTPELCARWHAVGAFYPFSRNHRACWGDPQEAWRFKGKQFDATHTYTDLMRTSIQRKYSLIRYYYTQLTQMALGNNTYYQIYKPLFFEFPDDQGAFKDLANNVMIGPALKTSVNAKSLTDATTDFYFPAGTWCSVFEPVGECIYNAIGQPVPLNSRLNESYAHLREGFLIPMQDAATLQVQTTVDLQNAPIDLHILGRFGVPGIMNWKAEGTYLNDDGLTTQLAGNVNQYRIQAQYSRSQGEAITLTFLQTMIATNKLNPATNCSAVNQADYLQSIFVYNATFFKQHDTFFVQASYVGSETVFETIGQATFDAATNRIVFDNSALKNFLCMTNLFQVVIKNLAAPVQTQAAA